MKSQQTQIKIKPINKKRGSGLSAFKLKSIHQLFLTREYNIFSKSITTESSYIRKEKTKKQKKSLFLLNRLIYVFIKLIKQKLLDFFWKKIKKTLNENRSLKNAMSFFIETSDRIFHSKLSWSTN